MNNNSSKKLKVHFSSVTDQWATPQAFFNEMNAKYGPFNLDVCASDENAKCDNYFVEADNGLAQSWIVYDGWPKHGDAYPAKCWMNPPYGREIGKWVKKAYEESQKGCLVVALLPARTDTKYFHNFIYKKPGVTIDFIKGRLKFGNATNSAPFPSMVVVFNPTVINQQQGITNL